MKTENRSFRIALSLLGIGLFALSLLVLFHELKAYNLHDLARRIERFPRVPFICALALMVFNYLALTSYELLALRYIRRPVPFWNVALASAAANALGSNMGGAAVSGVAVRYRMYSSWGLSATEVARVVAFYSLTFVMGFLFMSGLLFSFLPISSPALHVALRIPGVIFLAVSFVYLALCGSIKKPLRIRDWSFVVPSPGIAVAQFLTASLDWILAAGILYVLILPVQQINFVLFLGFFVAAQLAGMLSQVPGGIGVFEAAMIKAMTPWIAPDHMVVILILYRFVYYVMPLMIASVFLGIHEISHVHAHVQEAGAAAGKVALRLAPHLLAFSVFMSGAFLLVTGALPLTHFRLLADIVPLPILELSHFMSSLAGVFLLFLARGIQRRIDAAYILSLLFLGLGSIMTLLHGFHYIRSLMLGAMFLVMLPCRHFFYRKTSLIHDRFSAGWFISVLAVLGLFMWLGFFSYKNVEYSHELWWQFSVHGNAPRFLRALVASVVFSAFFLLESLMRTNRVKITGPSREELDKAFPIIMGSPHTASGLALMGDKSLLFSGDEKAFIMYAVNGKSWVSLGDPVGPEDHWQDLIFRFRTLVDLHEGIPVFSEVGSKNLSFYVDAGFSFIKIGEEACISLENFSLEGGGKKDIRYNLRTLEKAGVSFTVLPKEEIPQAMEELKKISDSWLAKKATKEKAFSLGFFSSEYLRHWPAAVVRSGGRIVAFATLLATGQKQELSIDLMRYDPETAPKGVMDYLFANLALWGRSQGYRWFNMGMAPLAGLENREFAPLWHRIGSLIFAHAEYFYNFEGLRAYKNKFAPEWRARYIALPGGLSIPRVLTDIAALNSGGIQGIFLKK